MRGTDPTGRARLRLTARGAVALLLVVTLLGQIFSPGPVFVVGCVAAALLVQPRDLLPLVVTPPLVFFATAALARMSPQQEIPSRPPPITRTRSSVVTASMTGEMR